MSARRRIRAQTTGAERERPLAWPGGPEGVAAAGIDFEALAHVLANTCRFGGRTRQYHSLAAHAVVVSEEIDALDGLETEDRRRLALHALIADAPSVWLRGMPPASQRAVERSARLAAGIECAVREAAGLDPVLAEEQAELLRFVRRMTGAAERRDLVDADAGGGTAFPPLRRRIRPVGPGRAAKLWLARFRALAAPPGSAGAEAGNTQTTERIEVEDSDVAHIPQAQGTETQEEEQDDDDRQQAS